MKALRLIVSGRVQGVAFRYYARREAISLGVRGYVRNLPGGEVEIVAEGPPEAVDKLASWARTGPPMARVSGMEAVELQAAVGYSEFSVRR